MIYHQSAVALNVRRRCAYDDRIWTHQLIVFSLAGTACHEQSVMIICGYHPSGYGDVGFVQRNSADRTYLPWVWSPDPLLGAAGSAALIWSCAKTASIFLLVC